MNMKGVDNMGIFSRKKKFDKIVPIKETGLKPNVCDICDEPLNVYDSFLFL